MDNLKAHLSKIITGSLPGESAHLRMSPISRKLSSIARSEAVSYRESAVAVVLFESEGAMRCILTQRPTYEGSHSGQVSFPGGKREVTDENLEATAIRECMEEIGVDLYQAISLGKMTPVFIPVSSFHVEPFLFFLEHLPVFVPDAREVEAVLTISLRDLLLEENIHEMDISVASNMTLQNVPYFGLEGKQIWGATALVLNELKEILLQLSPDIKI